MNLGALMALVLVATRLAHVFSFPEPLHVVTSGYEEESLFAMFKMVHGLHVYADPHQLPFAASYFNWFYYGFYGTITSFILHLFSLSDIWIPTIGRAITFCVTSIGFFLSYQFFKRQKSNAFAFSLSALLWFGPLIGYWAMTVRPDLLGLFFDALALQAFVYFYPKKNFQAVILAALCCYLSWSCKQINVVMPGAIGLYLLFHRQWSALFLFSGLQFALYALTFALMPDNARNMLFFVNTAIPLSSAVLVENAMAFLKKALPIFVIVAALLVEAIRNPHYRRELISNQVIQLCLCGLLVWSIILLPASSKVGSAENYHFIALFFLTLLAASAISLLTTPSRWLSYGAAFAGLFYVAIIGSVVLQNRVHQLSEQHQSMTELQHCIKQLPQPLFVVNHYGALPWMNPSPQTFVLAYNYWTDRKNGIHFEHNGIGGLIEHGYFNSLILPLPITTEYDGASLKDYERQSSCQGYAVFTRKGTV